jgi:diguanylate cyclase (GGDEF)-like protein
LFAMVVGYISQEQMKADSGRLLEHLAYQLANNLDRGMYGYFQDIQTLASFDVLQSPAQPLAKKRALLEQAQSAYSDYAWIGLTDPQGTVTVSTQGYLEGSDVSERPWFIDGQGEPNVQDVHLAKLLAALVPNPGPIDEPLRFVDVTAPVRSPGGDLVGVLGAHLYWQWAATLRDTLLQSLQNSGQIDVVIVAANGETLLGARQAAAADSPDPRGADLALGKDLSQLQSFQAAHQGHPGFVVESWNGHRYLTGYAPTQGQGSYPGLGWVVLVRQGTSDAFAAAYSLQTSIVLWGMCVGLTSGAMGWAIAGRLVKPVLTIAAAAEAMRMGNGPAHLPIYPGQDEVAKLSRSVAHLFANLKQQKILLQHFNAELEQQVAQRTARLDQLNHQLSLEVDERKQAELALQSANQELQRLMLLDGLTGIANRRHFDHYLAKEWQRSRRAQLPLALILIDIDYFKAYNDHYGHQRGDDCLRQVAQAIYGNLRRPADLAARYGGEEFVVVLPHTSLQGATHVAELLRQAVLQLALDHAASPVSPYVTISLGVAALVPYQDQRYTDLVAMADARLYQAKAQGRDRVVGEG